MDYNFNYLGNCDISNLKKLILNITEQDWQEHQIRQNTFEVHQHTNTLEILWDINCLNTGAIGETHSNYYKLNIDSFFNKIKPLYENIYGEGYFIRALITRLKPNTIIDRHIDGGDALSKARRTHIPLYTNSNILFEVGDEIINMKEGEIWEINNSGKEHAVYNNSNEYRIHFIIDYQPK